jgi:hypothetical protein
LEKPLINASEIFYTEGLTRDRDLLYWHLNREPKLAGGTKMGTKPVGLLILSLLAFSFAYPTTTQAVQLNEGMTQGDFAVWLLKAVQGYGPQAMGPGTQLQAPPPPAFQADEAIDFLMNLGIQPAGGWKKDEPLTKEALASMLPDDVLPSEEKTSLMGDPDGFNQLSEKVKDYVQAIFDERRAAGVLRIRSDQHHPISEEEEGEEASPSAPTTPPIP